MPASRSSTTTASVVDRRAVGAGDDEVVLERVLEGALAADDVVDDGRRPRRGRAGARRPRPRRCRGSRGCRARPRHASISSRPGGGAVGVPAGDQLLDDLGVALGARGLEDRLAVVVDPEPVAARRRSARRSPASSARGRCPRCAGRARAPRAAGEQPVEQGGAGAADVEGARRRRSEADAHRRTHASTLPRRC